MPAILDFIDMHILHESETWMCLDEENGAKLRANLFFASSHPGTGQSPLSRSLYNLCRSYLNANFVWSIFQTNHSFLLYTHSYPSLFLLVIYTYDSLAQLVTNLDHVCYCLVIPIAKHLYISGYHVVDLTKQVAKHLYIWILCNILY